MSGLVHHIEQVDVDRVVAFTCPHGCGRHAGGALAEIFELSGEGLRCPSCLLGGLEANYWGTVEERFPEPLPDSFAVLPNSLQDHAVELGLKPHDLLVVWALDRHRRAWGHEVYPSQETIAKHTALSVHQVRRALDRLVKAKLIGRHQPGRADGKRGRSSTRYDLSPLWLKLADLAGKSATQPCAPNDRIATQGCASNAPANSDGVFGTQAEGDLLCKPDPIWCAAAAPEVEVGEEETLEGEPGGIGAAQSAGADDDAHAAPDDQLTTLIDPVSIERSTALDEREDLDAEAWRAFLAWRDANRPHASLLDAKSDYDAIQEAA